MNYTLHNLQLVKSDHLLRVLAITFSQQSILFINPTVYFLITTLRGSVKYASLSHIEKNQESSRSDYRLRATDIDKCIIYCANRY